MAIQDQPTQQSQSAKEQAEKLRRVLSMKEPAQAQAKPSEKQPKTGSQHPVR